MFGIAEQNPRADASPGAARELAGKLGRVRALLAERGLPGVVLAAPASVAWLTGGLTSPIERGAAASPVWLLVGPSQLAAVTTNVERDRLAAESPLLRFGFDLHEVDWFADDAFARAAERLLGRPAAELGADAGAGVGVPLDDDLVALRLALVPEEQERLAALAADTAAALEEALRAWQPGERDLDLQAGVAAGLERRGCLAACLIVGGDERVRRFRHPLAVGAPVNDLAMAVVVAERHGLHAAATRFASAGPLDDGVRPARAAAAAVEAAVLAATRPGATYGEILAALADAYAAAGHPGAWRDHYQGGPIGYRQREFEVTPANDGSRWLETPVEAGHAVAWNPSVAGGGKCEDTYLVGRDGLVRLTDTGDWPLEGGRPAVLDLSSGGAA